MKARKTLGLIDTISFGFVAIGQHPWLVALPLILDLLLWKGPALSARPLFLALEGALTGLAVGSAEAETLAMARETVSVLGAHFNLLSLLALSWLGMPTLLTRPSLSPDISTAPAVTGAVLPLTSLSLLVIGVVLASLWLGLISRALRAMGGDTSDDLWQVRDLVERGLRHALSFIGMGLLVIVGFMGVVGPMIFLFSVVALANLSLAMNLWGFFLLVLGWMSLWMLVHFFFAAQAVVLHNAGPLRAFWHSFNIVGRNFWQVLGFILLHFFISNGLGLIWESLAQTEPGMLVAIVGHSVVGVALLAASFIFYADRYQQWLFERREAHEGTARAR